MVVVAASFCVVIQSARLALAADNAAATLDEVIAARLDLWGEAAMRQPNGASYEFFEKLVPPLRYVHADFRYYPIVLSSPRNPIKARLISNGSGINLSGGSRSWNDVGTPVVFRVGPDEFLFGGLRDRLKEPTLAEGYLPIVTIDYEHRYPVQSEGKVPLKLVPVERVAEVYRQEAFASMDPALSGNCVVLVKFSLAQGATGVVTADFKALKDVKFVEGRLLDDKGGVLAWFDEGWKWERHGLHAKLAAGTVATMALATKPLKAGAMLAITSAVYEQQKTLCASAWKDVLAKAMRVEAPEPCVNNAWRFSIIQNFMLLNGDRMHYSAGNQYDKLYEAEGSDAALAMMMWGYEDDMRKMIKPLLDFTRAGLEFHQAGLKINDVCRLYWQTRDAAFLETIRPQWEKEVKRMVEGRTSPDGLFPKENYCGDIHTPVLSLSANAKAWRALRDMSAVLGEIGQKDEAGRLSAVAVKFRKDILTAIDKSVIRETTPPFVPVALLSEEPAHDPITGNRIGSYWGLVINYIMGSGIFPPGSEQETWVPRYLETHGGLCMGMTRSGSAYHGFWTGPDRTNPLYGTRYVQDTLRRDDPERAVVSFYGMLAHGLTRNTFVGGEGATLRPVDDGGRFFYCPPNSAANGHLIAVLRYLLVQDWDLNDDGRPETLRLLFASPRRWLEDGKSIVVEKAPTVFGPVSVSVASKLTQNHVTAKVDLPQRNKPAKVMLRIRVPDGWRVVSGYVGDNVLTADALGTFDLTELSGRATIRCQVEKR